MLKKRQLFIMNMGFSNVNSLSKSIHPLDYESESTQKTSQSNSFSACDDCCEKRSVSFGTISMRKFERVLGDHPCVSSGAPIALGWRFNQYDGIPLDEYEIARGFTREKEHFRIPRDTRVKILLEQTDVTLRELKDAELRTADARENMRKSIKALRRPGSQALEEIKETARRQFGCIARRRNIC
uniref:Uncharacterized protein n=1 Tax=Ditylum brightwellii TaxID=49249 RepID=A0A6U3SFZ4_9STRA|mmetsp:Transcript_3503/g.5430  ORF Transcript_3503/g.5430 Transcript_3503/m.5430 type:complete len:184 (+) Transcript_3503:70-621(+)